jgi:hypothetical protein
MPANSIMLSSDALFRVKLPCELIALRCRVNLPRELGIKEVHDDAWLASFRP